LSTVFGTRTSLCIKDCRGQILMETVIAMLVLLVLFFAIFESAYLIRDDLYLQRVAREAAREAVLTGSVAAGYAKGRDVAAMYFPGRNVALELREQGSGREHVVIARATVMHKFLGQYAVKLFGSEGMRLGARAVYGFWDTSEDYVD